jgi:oxidase EvaA
VRLTEETGSFDILELGPTIQMEFTRLNNAKDEVQKLFFEKLSATQDILYDVILSEEGGRFYHEQNRNVIIKVAQGDIVLTDDYLWMDFGQLNRLVQFNNVLNIQLRNLLSLIQITPEKV